MTDQEPLLASAFEFLAEALENFRDRKDSFAILHAVTACELALKAQLARVHPNLIFRDVDSSAQGRRDTVSLSKLPLRLANFGSPLSDSERELVSCFAAWRNQVVHHLPEFDRATARGRLPSLLDFLARFVRRHFDVDLRDAVPAHLYRAALDVLGEWKGVVLAARAKADSVGSVLGDPCPRCGATEVLTSDVEKRVMCHLCGDSSYVHDTCSSCGQVTPLRFDRFATAANVCDDCIEAAGDAYIQQLIDIERGK